MRGKLSSNLTPGGKVAGLWNLSTRRNGYDKGETLEQAGTRNLWQKMKGVGRWSASGQNANFYIYFERLR